MNLESWSLLVGSLLPPFVAIIQQPQWTAKVRAFVTMLICFVVGLGTVYFEHGGIHFDGHSVESFLLVLVAAQTTYTNFWKKTGIAPAIEEKTTTGHTH